jgi:hypothetical protein
MKKLMMVLILTFKFYSNDIIYIKKVLRLSS